MRRSSIPVPMLLLVMAVAGLSPAPVAFAEAPADADSIEVLPPSAVAGTYPAAYSSTFDFDGFALTGSINLPQGGNEDGCDPIFAFPAGSILLLTWDPDPATQDCDEATAVAQGAAAGAAAVLLQTSAAGPPRPTATSVIPAVAVSTLTGNTIRVGLPAVGRIAEDLMAPAAVSLGDLVVPEGDSGSGDPALTVTLSRPLEEDIAIAFRTGGPGTATGGTALGPGVDFLAKTGRVLIPAGATSGFARVTVAGDGLEEPTETFTVTLLSVTGSEEAALEDPSGEVTIRDDDPPVPNRIRTGRAHVWEGNDVTLVQVPIVLTTPAPAGFDVVIDTEDGTAVGGPAAGPGVDYLSGPLTVRVRAGRTHAMAVFTVFGDLESESNEYFTVRVISAPGYTIVGSGRVVIRDDVA